MSAFDGAAPHDRTRNLLSAPLGERWRAHVPAPWTERWKPRAFELAGGVVDVVEMGEGPPLLLAPPVPGRKEAFVSCAPLLARHFRVVAFDSRTRFGGRPSWDVLLADLDRIADAFAPGRFVLLGHSHGGALAQRYARARPERVRGLVLSSSFTHVELARRGRLRRLAEPAVLAMLRAIRGRAGLAIARHLARNYGWVFDPRCDDAVLAIVLQAIHETRIRDVAALVRLALEHDSRPWLASLGMPALVLTGERDTALARSGADELMRALPVGVRDHSPGAGHLHPLSSPEWFARRVSGWAAELPESRRPAP